MRRQHNRARIATKADRNQVYAFTEIRRLTGALSLPERVRDSACVLFESAQNEDLLRGRSLEGFAAAAVYAACRVATVARTRREVVDAARADAAELRAAYDAMNERLGLPVGPIDPGEYLPRFASRLHLDTETERRARALLGAAADAGDLVGRNPSGVAAAALYAADRESADPVTQAAVATVGDVSPATIRDVYYVLRDAV